MSCPVCSGAFSWKEDLLHHLGAVHHLEDLIAHLESEFTCETCPPCCRVPQTLFKSLLPDPAVRTPSSVRGSDGTQGNQFSPTKCSRTDSPAYKIHRTDDAHGNGDGGGTKRPDSRSSPRRKSADICDKSIERYHCDLCEFSANDIDQLVQHCSEQHSAKMPPTPDELAEQLDEKTGDDSLEHHSPNMPPTPDELSEAVGEEAVDGHTPRKQAQDRHYCDFCPFSTTYPHSLVKHTDMHKRSDQVQDGYKCAYCSNMASRHIGAVRNHQNVCHRGQPFNILCISGGKVVKGSGGSDSVSKTVQSKLSSSAAKKQSKLKLSKSKLIAIKRTSQKTATNKQSGSSSSSAASLSMDEVLSGDHEGSTEALESKLPERMIYPHPVCCPLCEFGSCVRVNLVRHIRLTHGNHQQSQSTTPDPDKPTAVPSQV